MITLVETHLWFNIQSISFRNTKRKLNFCRLLCCFFLPLCHLAVPLVFTVDGFLSIRAAE